MGRVNLSETNHNMMRCLLRAARPGGTRYRRARMTLKMTMMRRSGRSLTSRSPRSVLRSSPRSARTQRSTTCLPGRRTSRLNLCRSTPSPSSTATCGRAPTRSPSRSKSQNSERIYLTEKCKSMYSNYHWFRGFAKVNTFQKSTKKTWIELTHPNFFFWKPITDMDRTLKS